MGFETNIPPIKGAYSTDFNFVPMGFETTHSIQKQNLKIILTLSLWDLKLRAIFLARLADKF